MSFKISRKFLLKIAILLCFNISTSEAFPSIPGSCRSGAGVGGSHIGDKNGTLASIGANIMINGQYYNENDEISLSANETYELELNGNFRGFLVKVSGDSDLFGNIPNAYGTLSIANSDSQVLPRLSDSATSSACPDNDSGLGHTSNVDKSRVKAFYKPPSEGEFTLEVTIVTGNRNENEDGWYYSQYKPIVGPAITRVTAAPVVTTNAPIQVVEAPEESEPSDNAFATKLYFVPRIFVMFSAILLFY